jgi:hypothetical protein
MNRLGEPPVDYLQECSSTSLRYFEMSKLEHVVNLRRELSVLLEQMTEESALALFARWMIEKRTEPASGGGERGNGDGERACFSRRARRLLAEFLGASARARGSEPAAKGPDANGRLGELGAAEASAGGALDWRNLVPPAKEPDAPPRANARSEKRPDRKSSRSARA